MQKKLLFLTLFLSSWLNCSDNTELLNINPAVFGNIDETSIKITCSLHRLHQPTMDIKRLIIELSTNATKNELVFTCKNNDQTFAQTMFYNRKRLNVSQLNLSEMATDIDENTGQRWFTIPFKR